MNNLICIILITSSFILLGILYVLFFNAYILLVNSFKYIGKTGLDLGELYNGNTTEFITKIKPSNNQYNDYIGIGPILVINLDKDKERIHHLLSECKEENLYAVKTGNCCPGKLSEKTNSRFIYNNTKHSYGNYRYLRDGEKKCFLSHEQCWKKAANQKLPSLIVEDDISFPYNISRILKQVVDDINHIIDSGGPPAITVRLSSCPSKITGKSGNFKQIGDTCLGTDDFGCGAWAYILTPAAARTLLKVSSMDKIMWPVDHFINPPGDRQSYKSCESRIPPQSEYMFLEAIPEVLKPINSRYKLKMDRKRSIIIQELSTDLQRSRSQEY
jgi:GR25 family glycosyltransferase involved in LPS biosynthesis